MRKKAKPSPHKTTDTAPEERPEVFGADNSRRSIAILGTMLAILTLTIYWQVGGFDFIHLDDNVYLADNPRIATGLNLTNILWAFTSVDVAYWHPLTLISHMIDVQFFGLNPRWHHLNNVIIHTGATLLLLSLLFQLTGKVWRSFFVAALFALHPLHVESVAWVAERKDVLSGFFWILTILLYTKYAAKQSLKLYFLTFFSFVLAIMSKPMTVTLPVVLLLLDYWPLGRFDLETQNSNQALPTGSLGSILPLLKEKLPFLACSIFSSVMTIYALLKVGGMRSANEWSLLFRLENSVLSYLKYIILTLWPFDLAILYPERTSVQFWQFGCALISLLLITVGVLWLRRSHPFLAVGWFWFLITLLPVIGLTQAGVQSMADRFTYLPHIGLFIIFAWGVPSLSKRSGYWNKFTTILAGMVIIGCALITWQQLAYWRDEVTLYTHALQVTQRNYTMHANLGGVYLNRGDLDAATREYQEALRINPDYADGHYNLGLVHSRKNESAAAIREYQAALKLNPSYAAAHNNLGVALTESNDWDGAIREYQKALEITPEYADARNNLGAAYAARGELDKAIKEYRQVLAFKPDHAAAHNNLGEALAGKGELEEAINEYRNALAINPNFTEAENNLTVALSMRKRP